jgi:DNA N-6-adenine-methyltransferase (Dam)
MSLKEYDIEREADHWATPFWLKEVFDGWFDPCPIGGANGLSIRWEEKTFANIPYSDPLPWVLKAIGEWRDGKKIVLLVRVDTSAEWWLRLVEAGAHFAWFIHDGEGSGRLAFSGSPKKANFASALVFLP